MSCPSAPKKARLSSMEAHNLRSRQLEEIHDSELVCRTPAPGTLIKVSHDLAYYLHVYLGIPYCVIHNEVYVTAELIDLAGIHLDVPSRAAKRRLVNPFTLSQLTQEKLVVARKKENYRHFALLNAGVKSQF